MVRCGPPAGDSSAVNCLPGLWTSAGAQATLSSCCLKAPMVVQVARTKTAPESLNSATSDNRAKHKNRLTIPSSAASEASPLQRVVRQRKVASRYGDAARTLLAGDDGTWPRPRQKRRCLATPCHQRANRQPIGAEDIGSGAVVIGFCRGEHWLWSSGQCMWSIEQWV